MECNRPVIPKPVSVLLMALSLGECVGRNVNALTPNIMQRDEQNTEHLLLCVANYSCSYANPRMLGCCGLAADNIGHLILAGTEGLKVNHSCT